MSWPTHDPERLAEAFRRSVLRLFVRKDLFEEEHAQSMLAWPHSGFHVHDSVWVGEDDRPFALRLARYCARNPVALERLTYDAASAQVTYRSDNCFTINPRTRDPLQRIRGENGRLSLDPAPIPFDVGQWNVNSPPAYPAYVVAPGRVYRWERDGNRPRVRNFRTNRCVATGG